MTNGIPHRGIPFFVADDVRYNFSVYDVVRKGMPTSMRQGFDNEKYIELQAANIRKRIAQFGGKLYLEFGGKLFVALIHGEFAVPGFDHERWLGDGLAVHAHMPGLDESLRFGPRFDQSRSHEHHVKSVKWSRGIDMLLGHISSFRPTIHQRGGSAWSHHPALHVIFRWRENESPLLAL